MNSPANTNHRSRPFPHAVINPLPASSSQPAEVPYSEAVSVELRRIIILALILFWLIVGTVWWAA